jgi:hypothetical protein
MGHEVWILIVPFIVYAMYQDLKDAYKACCQQGDKSFFCKFLRNRHVFDDRTGRF